MKDRVIMKRIWHFAKPYKWAFLLSYSVLLVELALHQIIPLLLENVINFAVYPFKNEVSDKWEQNEQN